MPLSNATSPSGGLSPVPQQHHQLRRQTSQTSLQSTTTYHSVNTSLPSPILARSSLHIHTNSTGRSSPIQKPLPPRPQAEDMVRTDSVYADCRASSAGVGTPSPPIRTNSPTLMSPTLSSMNKGASIPASARKSPRPSQLRLNSVKTESLVSSHKRSTSSMRQRAGQPSPTKRDGQRPTPSRRQSETPVSPTESTTSNHSTSASASASTTTTPHHSTNQYRDTSTSQRASRQASKSRNPATSTSRPTPNRASTGNGPSTSRRVSRPLSQRRSNTSPLISHTMIGTPSREVPFQYFQFPTLEDGDLAGHYPSPPGSSHRPLTSKSQNPRSRKNTASSQISPLGISGLNNEDDSRVGTHVPATVQYWTSPETRRKEYAAIDAASRGIKGFALMILPDCMVPKEYKVMGFSEREDSTNSTGEVGEELRERGRRPSAIKGSIGRKGGKRGRGDDGSVRRYRIEIEDVTTDTTMDESSGGSTKGSETSSKGGIRKRRWFGWIKG